MIAGLKAEMHTQRVTAQQQWGRNAPSHPVLRAQYRLEKPAAAALRRHRLGSGSSSNRAITIGIQATSVTSDGVVIGYDNRQRVAGRVVIGDGWKAIVKLPTLRTALKRKMRQQFVSYKMPLVRSPLHRPSTTTRKLNGRRFTGCRD